MSSNDEAESPATETDPRDTAIQSTEEEPSADEILDHIGKEVKGKLGKPSHLRDEKNLDSGSKYKSDRIFFINQAWLPSETPAALKWYRDQELLNLRGDGTGKLEEWDRVYDYAYYNDFGEPDSGEVYARPVLGGSAEYPYPRRGRTGGPPSRADPKTESRLPQIASIGVYTPRDEKFSPEN